MQDQVTTMKAPEGASPLPKLLVSSEEAGWEEIVVRAYHEPAELELIDSGMRDSSLVLIARGAVHLEQRPVNGPWSEQNLHQGDLLLQPGGATSSELRWKCLSPQPLHLLSIQLSHDLLARTTRELTKHDPARLDLVRQFGFQDPLLTQIGLALWQEV